MRIAAIADIHGNVLALEAVLADIAGRGVDSVVDLGDRVSGPLWPRETFERLESAGIPGVRGNHDRWVAEAATADAVAGSDRVAFDALTPAQRAALMALPVTMELAPGILCCHATPRDDNTYLFDDVADGRLVRSAARTIAGRLGAIAARIILCAHSHRADMVRLPSGTLIVNPGSVGCPAYADPTGIPHVSEAGAPHARYAIVDVPANAGEPAIAFVALPYDHEAAARHAESFDRRDWAGALRTGFMPNA